MNPRWASAVEVVFVGCKTRRQKAYMVEGFIFCKQAVDVDRWNLEAGRMPWSTSAEQNLDGVMQSPVTSYNNGRDSSD